MGDPDGLFAKSQALQAAQRRLPAPLAERMRPRAPEELVGQEHLLGEEGLLTAILRDGLRQSLVLWGPPGSGKTTLAHLIAERSDAVFEPFSAVLSGIAEIRQVMRRAAEERDHSGRATLLFVDEIHRFNKAQQDAFLPFAERGDILLVGATTENPSFELNAALLSRARVLVLRPLEEAHLVALLARAVADPERGLAGRIDAPPVALREIARASDGDARRALTLLETAAILAGGRGELGPRALAQALQKKAVRHDKSGEEHYNLISALHKSVRNSNADAALYWITRLLEAGEDRDFLARRLVRMAVEDIGLGDPDALGRCLACWDTWRRLGSPEGELALVSAAVLLARAPKSNAVYRGYGRAREDVQRTSNEPVPLHLCNAPTHLMKELGYGKGYRYAHDDPDAVREMVCMPPGLADRRYLEPEPPESGTGPAAQAKAGEPGREERP
jgi:putative ATPase